jgi:hypothetical protein
MADGPINHVDEGLAIQVGAQVAAKQVDRTMLAYVDLRVYIVETKAASDVECGGECALSDHSWLPQRHPP